MENNVIKFKPHEFVPGADRWCDLCFYERDNPIHQGENKMERNKSMTQVFYLHDAWRAQWNGMVSPITFNSKGAAMAYLETCNRAGKLRS